VSSELHVPFGFSPGTEAMLPLARKVDGPRSGKKAVRKEIICYPCHEVNRKLSVFQVIAYPLHQILLLLLLLLLLAFTTHLRVLASSFLRFRDHTQ
jgi:hypothetical protein